MSIGITFEKGLICPNIICDKCGEKIEKLKDGLVSYSCGDYLTTIPKVETYHKNHAPRKLDSWRELDSFLSDLKYNAKIKNLGCNIYG